MLLALKEFSCPEGPVFTQRCSEGEGHLPGKVVAPVRHDGLSDFEYHFERFVDEGFGEFGSIFLPVRSREHALKALEASGYSASRLTILDAATLDDVLRALAAKPYSLIHFSGHGNDTGIFVEQSGADLDEQVSVARVEQALIAAQPYLKIAVFLSCFSASFAKQLAVHVPYVLTVTGPADDDACVKFVECFYARLLEGDDIERAYVTAVLRVKDLDIVLQRRAVNSGTGKALVQTYTYPHHPTLYVDVSRAHADMARLEMSEDNLLALMSRKIYYHAWAFRYPRSNAILSVGSLFASFSWDKPEDCIFCDRLFRLEEEAPEDLARAFAQLLIEYSDRYVANYRSPIAPHQPDFAEQVETGVMKMVESYQYFFGEPVDPEADARPRRRLPLWPDVLRAHVPIAFKTAMAAGGANLATAERKLWARDIAGAVANLEAALSSFHDLMNEVGQKVLD